VSAKPHQTLPRATKTRFGVSWRLLILHGVAPRALRRNDTPFSPKSSKLSVHYWGQWEGLCTARPVSSTICALRLDNFGKRRLARRSRPSRQSPRGSSHGSPRSRRRTLPWARRLGTLFRAPRGHTPDIAGSKRVNHAIVIVTRCVTASETKVLCRASARCPTGRFEVVRLAPAPATLEVMQGTVQLVAKVKQRGRRSVGSVPYLAL
jgi:hypothetical protein